MAIKYVVAHRTDPNNVGDIASNPLQYFLPRDEYEIIDVAALGDTAYTENVPLIVGGGGLIGNEFMGDEFLSKLLESSDRMQLERLWANSWEVSNPSHHTLFRDFNTKYHELISSTMEKISPVTAPRYIWGAGHNSPTDTVFEKIKWPKVLSRYKSIGIRDYDKNSRFTWTPCASCMHPALSKTYAVKNDVIWFEHKKQLIKDFGKDPIPRFINSGDNIEQTIELLGSANTILTNSYHGAYWGTLLKKKVIVVGGAWSSKFKFFKHPPIVLNKKEEWQDYREVAPIYENALDECRIATQEFWKELKDNR
jgi:hypothetical protein